MYKCNNMFECGLHSRKSQNLCYCIHFGINNARESAQQARCEKNTSCNFAVFAILNMQWHSISIVYVPSEASETLFRMATWRGLVRPVPHGEVAIFAVSVATLLYCYRSRHAPRDSIYSLFRFIVGPFEEHGYGENREDLPSQHRMHVVSPAESRAGGPARPSVGAFSLALNAYKNLIQHIKSYGRHAACPHPFSCTSYVLQGTVKLFSLGYGLQACLRLLLQMRRVVRRPSILPRLLFHKNALKLGAFLGGLSGTFRLVSCLLRWTRNKDSKFHAIPAGLLAGLSFAFFPDNTIALYVMWKSLQIIYNTGVERGYLPEVSGFTILLYTVSTAILFHAAILEPHNLRPSYWKFLFSISGGRISTMDRKSLDAFGLESSRGLLEMAHKTKTPLLPISYFE
ncbi:transmembrane protein 135-like isoform X2 [Bacillus rossius redtenbacheri]|uniref:transmembrane protein 135-like isoform X2 n=1 Tax=Bacillus rossius redtenbacheri TaxID=93214 RepID=UPI002FDE4FFC